MTITFPDSADRLAGSLAGARRVLVLGTAEHALAAAAALGEGGRVIGIGAGEGGLDVRGRLGHDRVTFEDGEPERLPVEDGSLDVVVAAPPVALGQRRGRFLIEVSRALRADGRLVVIAAGEGPSARTPGPAPAGRGGSPA